MTDVTDPRVEAARTRAAARHGAFAAATDALLAAAAARRLTLDTSPREFERLKARCAGRPTEGAR